MDSNVLGVSMIALCIVLGVSIIALYSVYKPLGSIQFTNSMSGLSLWAVLLPDLNTRLTLPHTLFPELMADWQ